MQPDVSFWPCNVHAQHSMLTQSERTWSAHADSQAHAREVQTSKETSVAHAQRGHLQNVLAVTTRAVMKPEQCCTFASIKS